jgi:hypothetical protein
LDGVAKRWPVVLAAPLGQAKPLCHLNTALRPKLIRRTLAWSCETFR